MAKLRRFDGEKVGVRLLEGVAEEVGLALGSASTSCKVLGGMSKPLGQAWQAEGSELPFALKELSGQSTAVVTVGQ